MAGSSFECIITDLDVRPLLESIEAQPHLWDQITARQSTPGSPHVDTRTIFLRWSPQQTVDAAFNDLVSVEYPALSMLPSARELIAAAVAATGATQLGRVIIVNLKPGGRVTPHADEGLYADTFERFHIVLQSDFGNFFCVSSKKSPRVYEVAEMVPGELWCFNHKRTHWVENQSNRDRIHMIIDMIAPSYRVERSA